MRKESGLIAVIILSVFIPTLALKVKFLVNTPDGFMLFLFTIILPYLALLNYFFTTESILKKLIKERENKEPEVVVKEVIVEKEPDKRKPKRKVNKKSVLFYLSYILLIVLGIVLLDEVFSKSYLSHKIYTGLFSVFIVGIPFLFYNYKIKLSLKDFGVVFSLLVLTVGIFAFLFNL
ncbi:hypothetical protein [Tenacibaculum sp. 190524A02b]|uniref:hypothetical protein n=1 Tax=Tenacibaculum vairaonense TaxID=3137860 RepID=UPI0031FABAC7